MLIYVRIRVDAGPTVIFDVMPTDTVGQIKARLLEMYGYAVLQQRMQYQERAVLVDVELEDGRTLESFGIHEGTVLSLFLRGVVM